MEKKQFQAESQRLLDLMINSIYTHKEIILREILSNASDAITMLRRLESLGVRESAGEQYAIHVVLDKDAGTLSVSDNGIGMTEEELTKYICNIALSGAVDFIQKYENEADGSKNGIIGHIGLGIYSSFMLSDRVEVVTKSYTAAPAVRWLCNVNGEYQTEAGERDEHGTTVTMHIAEGEKEYLETSKIRAMLEKICSFLPVESYFEEAGKEVAPENSDDGEKKEPKAPEPINDTHPLWLKRPAGIGDELLPAHGPQQPELPGQAVTLPAQLEALGLHVGKRLVSVVDHVP